MSRASWVCALRLGLAFIPALFVGVSACGSESPRSDGEGGAGGSEDADGSGGTTASGGSIGTGGSTGTGGAEGMGGSTETGGSEGTGGNTGTGGSEGTGGSAETGGSAGTGGSAETGGSAGMGGSAETGGAEGTGGSTETGGSAGTGGTSDPWEGTTCDYVESRESDPTNGTGAGRENTGLSFTSTVQNICGIIDDANDDMVTADADFFDVQNPAPSDVPRFVTITMTTAENMHLADTEIRLWDVQRNVLLANDYIVGGYGKIIYGISRAVLDTSLVLWEPINSGPFHQPYVISWHNSDDCTTTGLSPTFAETENNDVYTFAFTPAVTLTGGAGGIPDVTGFTVNPGDSYRITGVGEVTSGPAGDNYNDRDAFEMQVNSNISHLLIRLSWDDSILNGTPPPFYTFGVDYDVIAFYYFPGGSIPVISHALHAGLDDDELLVVPFYVQGTYTVTVMPLVFKDSIHSAAVPYTLSVCGVSR